MAYDDIAQGRSPEYILKAAILSHFMGIIIHNNTVELLDELKQFDLMAPVNFSNTSVSLGKWVSGILIHTPSFMLDREEITEEYITNIFNYRFDQAHKSIEQIQQERQERMAELIKEVLG